jgi:purine-nucleoside phosphorylase
LTYEALQAAASHIATATGRDRHRLAVVLGSGLSSYAAGLPSAVAVPYDEIPDFPRPRVDGHPGTLFSVELGGEAAMILAGRVHTYEGWEMSDVVFAVRTAILAGCETVMLTNAAGGIGEGMNPGDLVLIRDHLNLTGRNPLVGETAAEVGLDLAEGVYAWFLGPSYETPAEVQMARRLGADLVGMSTVPEAIAARHMGARVLAMSLVTNLAAGISPTPLSHEEVTEVADVAKERFAALLDALLPRLASSE